VSQRGRCECVVFRSTPEKGKELFTRIESVQPLDTYAIQLRLHEKTALVLPLLLGEIYPKEVLDEAGDGPVRTFIGTGPFKAGQLGEGEGLCQEMSLAQHRSHITSEGQ